MTEVVVFHHALGLTPGVIDFAEAIASAGYEVHTPDLFDGERFTEIEDGVAHAQGIGFSTIIERGAAAVAALPSALVYVGFSLGVLPAQRLAQTREGARGAVLIHGCVPHTEFSPAWPTSVPVDIHSMADDPYFVHDGDLQAAQRLVASSAVANLYLYPGDAHLFADSGVRGFSPGAAGLLMSRILALLSRVS